LNVADVAPAATVTDPGTVSADPVSDKVTTAPPAGATLVKVTLQVLDAFCPRLAGLQLRVEISTGATRLTVVFTELPL